MSDQNSRFIESLASWLKMLADDARAVANVVGNDEVPLEVRRPLVGALNYLFKSLDLIDDGIEVLGFVDDAFVFRVGAAHASGKGAPVPEVVERLAGDAEVVRDFLGELFVPFDRMVQEFSESTVRERSVESILKDVSVREEMIGEVNGWAARYEPPFFAQDEKSLVKIRSFMAAKLQQKDESAQHSG